MTRTLYFIGAGTIARAHASGIDHLPDSDSVEIAAADPSPDARTAFEEQVSDVRLYEKSEQMLAEVADEDDIVVVAAPPFVHHDEAIAALESGRHVLCEKPLAMNREEADEMLAAAQTNDRLLGCCSCRHYLTAKTRRVAELLDEGSIGDPYHATWINRTQRGRPGIEYQPESKWFLDSSKSGGGIVIDWGPYEFATLDWLLKPDTIDVEFAWTAQPLTEIDSENEPFDVETHAGATLVYRNDDWSVPVTYERASGTHGDERSVMEIEGTEGAIRWAWASKGKPIVTVARDEGGDLIERKIRVREDEKIIPHERPLVYFDRRVRRGKAPIRVNEEAYASFVTIDAIYQSAESGEPQQVDFQSI